LDAELNFWGGMRLGGFYFFLICLRGIFWANLLLWGKENMYQHCESQKKDMPKVFNSHMNNPIKKKKKKVYPIAHKNSFP
jgi:hypothetical protein